MSQQAAPAAPESPPAPPAPAPGAAVKPAPKQKPAPVASAAVAPAPPVAAPVLPGAVPVDTMLDHGAYIWERNRRRLLVLFLVLTGAVILFGVRGIIEALVGLIGSAPGMLVLLLFYAFAMIAQFGALMFFLSRPRKYVVTPDNPQVNLSFDSYRGQPDLLEHARSTVKILQGIPKFRAMGGEPPKGMLLAGAPGTGKSYLAAVIAAEAKLPFIYIDASSMTSMWFGMDALIVVRLFSQARSLARKYAPPGHPGACIVFIDELDSIGLARGGVQGGQMQGGMGPAGMMGMRGFALNTLLNQMDSLGQHIEDRMKYKFLRWLGAVRGPVPLKPAIFVIGATNRPDVLDAALTRPGRLDRRLNVYVPDGEGRRDIIQFYLLKKAYDPQIDVGMMVADSIGWTPVQVKTIINEALIIAHDAGRDFLTYKDWLTAADMRQIGLKQPITSMSAEDKRTIAYHEAGHAVTAYYIRRDDRIQKASIIRMGDALGVVSWSPREERHQLHSREIEERIMVSLGSRAVEEVFLGTKTANASHDLESATNAAMAYIGRFGMGSTLLTMMLTTPMTGIGGPGPTMQLADRLLDQLYEEAKRLVREKDFAVHAVAKALLERGELIGSELDEVFLAAEEANPDKAGLFVRKPVELPKATDWRSDQQPAPAALPQAAGVPVPLGEPQPPEPGPLPPS